MGGNLRRIGVVVTTLCAVMALAVSASAAGPTKEVIKGEGIFSLGTLNCHGFKLVEDTLDETVTTTTYSDGAGNATKVIIKVSFFGRIANTKTGESFRDHVSFTETHDLVAGTNTITGSTYHFVDSGEGTLFIEGGRKVIVEEDGSVIFDAGPNDFTEGGDAALCDALA